MKNYWTQTLPKVSGYYWFSYEYEDTPSIHWVEVEHGLVSVWDHHDDGPVNFTTEDGYYYSAYPIETLPWSVE